MPTRFAHVNIAARDWRALATFYTEVFACSFVPPERQQSGAWLEQGSGVPGLALSGVHLRLPGGGDRGPTLEIYRYEPSLEAVDRPPNRPGLGHLAFEVDDVAATLARVCEAGGRALGTIVTREIPGAGVLTFVYAADPEGNALELQAWASQPSALPPQTPTP